MKEAPDYPLLETEFSQSQRYEEGWAFGPHDAKIKAGKSGLFRTDEEALAFVKKRADEGSEYHQQALAYVTKNRLMR